MLDPASLVTALETAAGDLGPVETLQFSPVPRADSMRPVLDTTAADLEDPPALSVKGSVTCVHAVLPGMRALGRGTHSSPTALAERLNALHSERVGFRHYAEPMPAP